MKAYFIGIDIGTQGSRVSLIDQNGNLISHKETVFELNDNSREEQSPQEWWNSCLRSLQAMIFEVKRTINLEEIIGISVTSTSGTVIPLDKNWTPLHNALMYSDQRSSDVAKLCQNAAKSYINANYTGFNSSSGLSKIVWFIQNYPEKTEKIHKWIHAADFITGKLSGIWGITDYTNAFKSGYDVANYLWPDYLTEKLGISKSWLPDVVYSGKIIGSLDQALAKQLGLPNSIKITAGITDGCASQIASGAIKPGDWNTTIGTTMVIKGVCKNPIDDPAGVLYSHRHPGGYWMPGGASNTGADWVTKDFRNDLKQLSKEANLLYPTKLLSYPLRQTGERFPFEAPQARGFEPINMSKAIKFTANMEGVAYIERLAYEIIEGLSKEDVNVIYTAGGGSNSEAWLNIRSNVLNKHIYKMKHVTGSVGAAILAASTTYFVSLIDAAENLTQIELEIKPTTSLVNIYDNEYKGFVDLLKTKGYI